MSGRKGKKRSSKILLKLIIMLGIVGAILYFGGFLDIGDLDRRSDEPELQIYDLNSDERPVGIMIDNVRAAWPHVGLGDAYLVYEMLVEGGQTRLLAMFKDQETEVIGPIRSARHYHIDYALENDSLFIHFGESPQTRTDINQLRVDAINGITRDGTTFWRDRTRRAPHNAFTSIENILEAAKQDGKRITTDTEPVLNYNVRNVTYQDEENAMVANTVQINYSQAHFVTYVFNPETRLYYRSMRGIPHNDGVTGAQYTARNIIVQKVRNETMRGDRERQQLMNVGTGEGYYITNGFAIPITWEKRNRNSQTVFKTLAGELIRINDGITFIQLQPINERTTFE